MSLLAYRIVKRKWASQAFDGEGARLYGGRWNSKGKACVYTASNPSLAMLEMLVHMNKADLLDEYLMFEITLEARHVMTAREQDLPANWRDNPAPWETARYGDGWLDSKASLALKVPSSISPDQNYLINIHHPDFEQVIQTVKPYALGFDARLK